MFCKHTRELYIVHRNSNNSELSNYYKKYCKIIPRVIKEVKRLQYDNKIQNSNNKNKTIWDIVKSETNNKKICTLNVDGKWIKEKQMIAETSNNYFLSVAEYKKSKK
jgi:23S rRNA pseudoU1915 N3-methylase RlmH